MFDQIESIFGSLDKPTVEAIKQYLKERKRPYHFAALYYYCQAKYGVAIQRPGRRYKPPEKNPRVYPSYEELEGAYTKIEPKLGDTEKVIIQLRAFSGRRISEVLMLKVSSIDFEKNNIIFEIKGGRMSLTPMNAEIREMLLNYIQKKELLGANFLFYSPILNPNTRHPEQAKYMQFRDKLERIDSGFSRMFLKTHDMRHAVISKVIIKKGLANANAWVDHKSMDTTKSYADEISRDKLRRDALEVMSNG